MEGEVASWWLLCPTPRTPGPASAISRRSKKPIACSAAVGPLRPAGVPGNHDGGPGQDAEPDETSTMVDQLGELIHTSLRQCDVAARYTETQYVIMLCGSAAEDRVQPAGTHQGVVLPRARSWPLPAQLQPVRARSQARRRPCPPQAQQKTVKYFRPAAKVSRLGGFLIFTPSTIFCLKFLQKIRKNCLNFHDNVVK